MFVHTVIMVIEPHMKQGRQHKLISTIFLATSVTKKLDHNTFQVESGDRMELPVSGREYGMLAEGDIGKLTFQGTRYLSFERV